MELEAKKYLHDILEATKLLTEFTSGKTFQDYVRDAMLRSAVERNFEIAADVDDRLVWDIIETKLSIFLEEVCALLEE